MMNHPTPKQVHQHSHLADVSVPDIDASEVALLIGMDNPEVFQQMEERRGKPQEPFAVRTPLGWTFYGVPTQTEVPRVAFHVTTAQDRDHVLEQQLPLMWKTDFSDTLSNPRAAMSVEDKKALSIMDNSLVNENKRYKLSLPWRNDPRKLPNYISLARSRLSMLRKRLQQNSILRQGYTNPIEDYITKRFARKVTPEEDLD